MTGFHRNESNRQLLLRRSIVYGLLIFFLAVIQCSFFSRLKIFGVVPDLMIGVVVGIAMLDSQRAAAVCGIGAGFVIDAIGSSGLSLSPLFYLIFGALCGALAKKMLPNFLSWTVSLAIFSAARSSLTLLNMLYLSRDVSVAEVAKSVLLPEAVCTFVICLPIFFAVKLCMIPIDSKRRLRLDKFN